jgi:hypothetical protein
MLSQGSANGGVLTNATWVQTVSGGLPGGGFFSAPMTRTLEQLNAEGISTGTSISLTLTYPATTTFCSWSKSVCTALDVGIQISQGGVQAIVATAASARADTGVLGSVIVAGGLPLHIGMGVDQSMFKLGASTLIRYPQNVGVAGLVTNTFSAVGVVHALRVDHFPWTPRSRLFRSLTSGGQPCAPRYVSACPAEDRCGDLDVPTLTAQGSFDLTPDGGGMVSLVAPTKITVDGDLMQRRTASFATLRLSFKRTQCSDGRDNDGDGLIDLADSNCASLLDDREAFSGTGGCGIGPELALLLPGLWWLKRRPWNNHGEARGC